MLIALMIYVALSGKHFAGEESYSRKVEIAVLFVLHSEPLVVVEDHGIGKSK